MWFAIYNEYHALEMLFTRKKQYPVQIKNPLQELSTKSIYVKYELPVGNSSDMKIMNYFQQVVEYSKYLEGEDLHYHVLGLNESSTEYYMKKSYRKMALQSHPDKNKQPQDSDVMRMINEAEEGLEDLLRYNDTMREQ